MLAQFIDYCEQIIKKHEESGLVADYLEKVSKIKALIVELECAGFFGKANKVIEIRKLANSFSEESGGRSVPSISTEAEYDFSFVYEALISAISESTEKLGFEGFIGKVTSHFLEDNKVRLLIIQERQKAFESSPKVRPQAKVSPSPTAPRFTNAGS